ncbi:hypothetical protein NKG94_45630 [Micromonospora sp. M12]
MQPLPTITPSHPPAASARPAVGARPGRARHRPGRRTAAQAAASPYERGPAPTVASIEASRGAFAIAQSTVAATSVSGFRAARSTTRPAPPRAPSARWRSHPATPRPSPAWRGSGHASPRRASW